MSPIPFIVGEETYHYDKANHILLLKGGVYSGTFLIRIWLLLKSAENAIPYSTLIASSKL